MRCSLIAAFALLFLPATAEARMLCTVVADATSGEILHEDGDCRTRVTPASTFKIPLAIMGFEDDILKGVHEPLLQIKAGEPDWGGKAWKEPTDPQRWMKYSVVWYSQRITAAMGYRRFAAQVKAFDYGNADVSGDRGQGNALKRSWISSSLKISPVEQAGFLRRLLAGDLPVSREAVEQTIAIVETNDAAGWIVHGKTGSAFPRRKDGSFDRTRGWGWYVGWVTKGDRTYTFARLDQDERREEITGGLRAREKFLAAWSGLADSIAR